LSNAFTIRQQCSSELRVTGEHAQGIELYVATGKQQHGEATAVAAAAEDADTPLERMKRKLKTEAGHEVYKMRKAIVEPVFGQIKEWRGFRRFGLRGLNKVSAEWTLICINRTWGSAVA
jgi:hypothetical protein